MSISKTGACPVSIHHNDLTEKTKGKNEREEKRWEKKVLTEFTYLVVEEARRGGQKGEIIVMIWSKA